MVDTAHPETRRSAHLARKWRIIRRVGSAESADETQDALRKVQVYFDDVLAYDLGQLSQEDMNEGFHRRAYAYVAELLRARVL